jgi:hypothetical protein
MSFASDLSSVPGAGMGRIPESEGTFVVRPLRNLQETAVFIRHWSRSNQLPSHHQGLMTGSHVSCRLLRDAVRFKVRSSAAIPLLWTTWCQPIPTSLSRLWR